MGPDGVPLDHGRTVRLFPAHVRRAAEVRDGGCVFAGRGALTWWCDVHHVLAWVEGGATDLDNAGLLCERHHTQVHHGYRVERRPDGRWRTWRPDGTEILIGPHRRATSPADTCPADGPVDHPDTAHRRRSAGVSTPVQRNGRGPRGVDKGGARRRVAT